MRKSIFTALCLFASLSLVAGEVAVPFDGKTDGLAPDGAKVQALPSGGAGPRFVPGRIPGSQAAHYGAEDALHFPLKESYYNPNGGCVSFWLRPNGWGQGKKIAGPGHFQPLWAIDSGNGSGWQVLAYCAWSSTGKMLLQMQSRGRTPKSPSLYFQTRVMEGALLPDQWTHVAFAWSSNEFVCYLNGEQLGKKDFGLPAEFKFNPKWQLWILPRVFWRTTVPGKGAYRGEYDIAELRFGDRFPTPAEAKKAYLDALAAAKSLPALDASVPAASAPKIDGVVGPAEWADATMLPVGIGCGDGMFNGELAGTLYVKHDGQNLYYAFQARSAVAGSSAAAGARDLKVYDGKGCVLDFWWLRGDGVHCQLGLAPNGAWNYRQGPKDWGRPLAFRHAGRADAEGWSVECALPLAAMGLPAGEAQKMVFCFCRPDYLADSNNRWLATTVQRPKRALDQNFGTFRLRKDGLAVRLGGMGQLNFGGEAFRFSTNSPAAPKIDSTLPLQATREGRETRFRGNGQLGSHTLKIQVDGLLDFAVKYSVLAPVSFQAVCHAAARRFTCVVDARGLADTRGATARVALYGADGKVRGECGGALRDSQARLELPFGELPQGDYRLVATVRANGHDYTCEQRLSRPDDAFLKERKGLERTVPWPFQPLKIEPKAISTAFIRYEFPAANAPFPCAAVNRGTAVLSRAVFPLIRVDGKDMTLRPKEARVVEAAPDRQVATGLMRTDDGSTSLLWTRTACYDGLLKYDLVLKTDGARRIDRFLLTCGLPRECSTYALAPNYRREWTEKGELFTFPSAWLAGEDGGFTFFSDNDVNWISKLDPLLMKRRPDGSADIMARFISEPIVVDGAVPYTIAMTATPTKPERARWRDIHSDGWGRLVGQNVLILMGNGKEHPRFRRGQDLSQPLREHIDWWRNLMKERSPGLKTVLPYIFLGSLSDHTPVADWYGADWELTVDGAPQAKSYLGKDIDGTQYSLLGVMICMNRPEPTDWLTYHLDKLLQDYPFYTGLYTDGGGVVRTDNPYPGHPKTPVLKMKNPPRHWDLFGRRDFFERVYKVIRARRGNDGIMFNHNWDAYYPALASFHDLIYPGEEYMHDIRRGMHVYIDETPLEKWQSNYRGRFYGATVQFLGQWRFLGGDLLHKPWKERHEYTKPLLMMCMLHDTSLSGAWYPAVEPTWKLWKEQNVADAVFTGYWMAGAVDSGNPKVKVSVYRWPGQPRTMLVLGNLDKGVQKAPLPSLQGKALVDAYTGKPCPLPVEVEANYGYRVLLLDQELPGIPKAMTPPADKPAAAKPTPPAKPSAAKPAPPVKPLVFSAPDGGPLKAVPTTKEANGGFGLDPATPYATIRKQNLAYLARNKSKFTWQDYLALLDELQDKGRYAVVAGEHFAATAPKDKVAVYFRHDIDVAPFHALNMATEEQRRGLRGSYYVLPDADYYAKHEIGRVRRYTAMDQVYLRLEALGHEVGVHSDLLDMAVLRGIDPMPFQKAELAYYRMLGMKVHGTVCHGGRINRWKINNTFLFSEFRRVGTFTKDGNTYEFGKYSLADFGFDYEGYLFPVTYRLSDIGNYDAKELLRRIRAAKPGERISLLLHPIHWREGGPDPAP